MEDKLKQLYNVVGQEYALGTYDEFKTRLQDEESRKQFYNIVGQEYNLGDYDSFTSNISIPSAPSADEIAEEMQPQGAESKQSRKTSLFGPPPAPKKAQEEDSLPQYDEVAREQMRQHLEDSGTIERMEEMEKEARKAKRKERRQAGLMAMAAAESFAAGAPSTSVFSDLTQEHAKEWSQNKAMEQTLDVALDKARAGEWGGLGEDNVGNGVVDFGLGLWDSATRMSTWDFGVSDTLNGLTIAQVVKKWEEDPESLTATERNLLDAMGMATAVQEAYQDQVGIGYAVGESLPQSAGFMASMYLNPASGLGKAAARQAVKKYGRQSIAKNLARIGGDIAETAIMTATTGGGRVVADALERINGQSTYEIDPETGLVMYGGQEDQKTVGEAVVKAIGSNFIENYSEALGEYFDPLLGMSRRLAAGGLRKMNLDKWADALSDVQPSQMAASIRSLREKAKFGGVFGEIMEEEVGMALNAITVGDYTFSKEEADASKGEKQWIFDLENQLTTALSCAIMSGALTGVETIGNVRYRREMERGVADAEKAARAAVGDEMIAQIDQASPEGMVDVLRDAYMDQSLSLQQKRALADYATQRVRMQYYNAADAKARRQVNVAQQNTIDAYESGRHAQLPQYYNINQEYRKSEAAINERENAEEIWDAIRLMNNMDESERQNIMRDFSEEDQELIRNWRYNAMRWQGAINHRAEQVEDLVDEYAGQVNPYTRPDGTLTTAILGDDVVYVMNEAENGDAVVYTNDGRKIFCKMRDLEHVQQHNAEELIERFRQQTTQAVEAETEKNLNYPSEVQEPAQGVTVETLDGKQWQVAATDGENVEIVGLVFDKKSGQWLPNAGDYRKMTREQFMDWQKAELDRKKANTYEQGDELVFYVNGEPIDAEITGIDPEGNYYVHVSNLVEGLDKAVSDVYTAEELRKLTTPSSKVSEKTTENEGTSTEEIKQSVSEEVANSQIGDTVGGSPVALSYLLEGGQGSIESAGYFLHGVAAAFPNITNEIEAIRNNMDGSVLGMNPTDFVGSGAQEIDAIRSLVSRTYGDEGVSIYNELLANSTGFVPKVGAALGQRIESLAETMSQSTEQGENVAEPTAEVAESVNTALSRVPKDAKGNPLYEQTDADTAWDAIMEQTEGDVEMAQRIAEEMVADKKAALTKMQKGKPKKGATVAEKIANEKVHIAAIAQAEQEVAAWEKIAQVNAIRNQSAELERAEAEKAAAEQRKAEEARILAEQEEQARIEREALNGVPDMVDDVPADARARGYRRVNGHKVDRQGVLPSLQGKEVGVKFANDMIVNGRVAVIEAETLQPSHLQGQRNPAHFIDEAQPKERNDEASIASARKIASNIRPEEITSSVTAYTGAPTVNMRGEAIQGNSRSDALRVMWAEHPDQAEMYKQYLIDHAEEFGLNAEEVAAMQHPVLVNMLDVSDTDAINLGQYVAQDTESGGTERIKAKNVARKMGGDIRSYANILLRSSEEDASFSELVDKNGVEVLKWMNTKGYITPTQYASAFDSKGNLTAEAKNDLRGVLYQSIFQGGNTQLEEQFNSLPAKAQKAILATAYRDYDSPNSERMVAEIQSSIRAYYALSHDRAFVDAKNYKEAKEAMLVWSRQYQMDDVTGESFLPSENFSNFALELAVVYKGWTQTNIQSHFNNVYDLVQGTKEASLFEEADNTPRALAEAIKETFNIEYNGQLNSNSLAVDSKDGQAGERGSDGDTASGERAESGEGSADSGRGTDAAREQGEVDGKRKVTANYFEMAEEAQKKRKEKKNVRDIQEEEKGKVEGERGDRPRLGKVSFSEFTELVQRLIEKAYRGVAPTEEVARIIREHNNGKTLLAHNANEQKLLKALRVMTNEHIDGLLNEIQETLQSGEIKDSEERKAYEDAAALIDRFKKRGERKAIVKALTGANLGEKLPLSKIDELFEMYNSDADAAELYRRVRAIAEQIGLEFWFEEGMGNQLGGYLHMDNRVRLNAHTLYSPYVSQQTKASNILHEMLHAVVGYAVKTQEDVKKGLTPAVKLSKQVLNAANTIAKIYEKAVKDNPLLVHEQFNPDTNEMEVVADYGTTSVEEMLVEISNPEFRDKLKQIEYNGRSVWQRIWDAIKSMFTQSSDVANPTAYDSMAKALDVLINEFSVDAYRKYSGLEESASRVYHGSGALFDKFDHSFMGTGEGNQAFGWGTYVSEAEGVGKTYAKIASKPMLTYKGQEMNVDGYENPWRVIKDLYDMTRGKISQMRADAEKYEHLAEDDSPFKPVWGEIIDILKNARRGDIKVAPRRVLYSVEIPDDNGSNYLKWYENVPKEVLAKAKGKLYDILVEGDYKGAERELKRELDDLFALEQTGQNLYGNISAYLGSDKEASQFLHEMGYVGLKYPTNTLHGGNIDGTNNYVIFDENDLEIVDNIRFRDGAPFFSNAERAVENIKQNKATPEQWLAMIKKDGGLKAGEDKWMGLSDWLNEQKEKGVKSLTKDEVLAYIRENQIEIEEVEYGDSGVMFEWADNLEGEYAESKNYPQARIYMYTNEAYYNGEPVGTFDTFDEAEDALAEKITGQKYRNSTRMDYSTSGLKNNKEIAFVVPSIEPWNQTDTIHFGDAGEGRAVAWVRFGETTDEDGNRVLVIDEVQSKRHDEGRSKGYKSDYRTSYSVGKFIGEEGDKIANIYDSNGNKVTELHRGYSSYYFATRPQAFDRIDEALDYLAENRGIPDAPFDKNYHELVMKRMLRYAAENGFDKVAWTKGKQQAERYDLAKHVSSIEYKPLANGHYNVIAYSSLGYPLDGVPMVYDSEQAIADVFGKDIAQQIAQDVEENRRKAAETEQALSELKEKRKELRRRGVDEDSAEFEETLEEFSRLSNELSETQSAKFIEGTDLSIGGEDRNALYDEMIPRFMNKYTKKWGTKVGEVTLPNVEEAGRTMWSVDVTPEMRESVMQGQPMFREGMGIISDREVSYENDPIAKFQGKPRYYGKKAAAFAERERRRMQKGVEETAKILGIEVEIITDASTLKGRKAKAKGWYDINAKKVVVVVPNHVSVGDAVRTVLHEGVAHHGLRELFGDGFDAMLDNIYNNVAPELKARIDAIAERTGVSTSVATEEYLASLAETINFEEAKNMGWWAKIKNYFVKMLNKLGMPGLNLKEEITDNELRYLLWRSYQNLVDPKSYLKPLGYLDDVAKQKELKVGEYAENTMATPRAAEDVAKHKDSDRRKALNKYKNNYDNALSFATGMPIERVRNERRQREEQRKVDAKEIYESVLSGDFNDVTLQKINDYIEDVTPQNPYGRRISQRLPQKLERSLHEGARANAVDALFSRISESAVPANERVSEAGRRKAEERKKELLKGWAIATGNWHTDLSAFVDDTTPIGEGTDSKVYISRDGAYVIKVSKGKPYGKRFRPDMDNIALFNFVFPNSAYEILGYGEIEGNFVRILKQPIVDFTNTTPLTPEEREEYMRELKFEPINETKTAFSNGEIVISDLQKSNIVKDAAGNISVIDADAKLHTKDVGGDYTYPPVERDLPRVNDDGAIRYRTSEEIEAEYPNWMEGTTTDSGKHSTQVEGTRKTYNKVGDWIEENLGKEVSILDASSGMGYGTADLRDRGFNIEDVEPYQSEERKKNNPATYSSYADIDKKYDFIISNAVLNVIPDDWRRDVLHNMAERMNDGGKLFINTRKAGEEKAIKDKIELDTPQEVLVKRNGKIASYQKFFTPQELKEWVESELGDGYVVEVANKKNSGTSGLAAVVVTKKADNGLRYKAESSLESQLDEMLTEYEEEGIIYTTPRDVANGLESILAEFDSDDTKELSEILDDFMRDQAESRSWGERMDAGGEDVFIDRLFEYRDRMRNRTSERNSEEIIAEVEREAAALGVPVRIVRSVDELPDEDTRKRAVDGQLKGYFDPRTGEVVVYEPNTNNANDAKRTVLHEIVGHKGLRQLIGEERYDKAMVQLMYMLPSEVRDAVLRRAERHGWNAAIAMDEYLAEQAERDVQPTWWGKVNAKIRAILRNLGFNVRLTDADVTYLLWRSRKKLMGDTAFDMATNAILKQAARKSAEADAWNEQAFKDAEMRDFEKGAMQRLRNRIGDAQNEYDSAMKSMAFKQRESWQDSMRSLKVFMDIVAKESGKKIADWENAYMYENAMSSANLMEMQMFRHDVYGRLLKAINELMESGAKHEEVVDYMMAKHGLERNEKMARAEAKEKVERWKEKAVEEMQAKAAEKLEKQNQRNAVIEARAKSAYKVKKQRLKGQLERGTISEAQYDHYMQMTEQAYQNELATMKTTHPVDVIAEIEKINTKAEQKLNEYWADHRDYSGLTALTGKDGVAGAESAAMQMIADFEAKHNTDLLWNETRACTQTILNVSHDAGILSDEVYDELWNQYEYYIPLRGFDETTAEEVYTYVGDNKSPYNAPIKTAKGRKSKADDPIATIATMAESAIVEANRNRLKQRFLYMVERHRTELASVSSVWVEKDPITGDCVARFANIPNDATPEEAAQAQKAFEERMEQLHEQEPERYYKASEKPNIPYRVEKKANEHEHQVIVKRGGKDVVITINGDPRVAQAINGLTNAEAVEGFSKFAGKVNRFLSANFTTRNPAFVVSNFVRDGFYTNSMVWAKEGRAYAWKYNQNFTKATILLPSLVSKYKRYEKGDKSALDMSDPVERAFYEFMINGGETGYTVINSVEDYKGIVAGDLKTMQGGVVGNTKKAVQAVGEVLDTFGRWAEDTSRFAAFLTSREMGRSVTKSIWDAKEISVNFNKKGSGRKMTQHDKGLNSILGWMSQQGRNLYVFWNAGMQGLYNFGKAAKEHPGKMAGLAGVYFGLGVAIAAIFGGHDDDEDYWNLPEYVRRNNICFRAGNKFVALPLPIELRAIYGMGELAMSWMAGKEDPKKVGMKVVQQMSQVMPIDMMAEGGGLMAFVPSWGKPIVEVGVNTDWTGMPIYRKRTPFNEYDPTWMLAFKSTSPELVAASRAINEATNKNLSSGKENKYDRGWADIEYLNNPAAWEHIAEGYLGGLATMFNQTKKSVMAIWNEDLREVRNVPVVSRFLKDAGEKSEEYALREDYFNAKKVVEELRSQRGHFRKESIDPSLTEEQRKDVMESRIEMEEMSNTTISQWNSLENARKRLEDMVNDNPDQEVTFDGKKGRAEDALDEVTRRMVKLTEGYQ